MSDDTSLVFLCDNLETPPTKPFLTRQLVGLMRHMFRQSFSIKQVQSVLSRFLDRYTLYVLQTYAYNTGMKSLRAALAAKDIPDVLMTDTGAVNFCYNPECLSLDIQPCYWHKSCGNYGCSQHLHTLTRKRDGKALTMCGDCTVLCEIFSSDLEVEGVEIHEPAE